MHYVGEDSNSRDRSKLLEELKSTDEAYALEGRRTGDVSNSEQDQSYADSRDYATVADQTDPVYGFESRCHTPAPRWT